MEKLKHILKMDDPEQLQNIVGGIPDGTSKEYYRNGELKSKGKYEKGKKTGKWVYYHQSGEKESEGVYKNDQKVKVWKYYDNNGNLKDEIKHSLL